jgi:hypothetical protein
MTISHRLKAAFAAAILMIGHGEAMAQASPEATFRSAVAALKQRLGPAETGPAIGTTDTAANAADIAAIEAAMGALGSAAFPLDGFTTFDTVCKPLNELSVRHLLDDSAALRRPEGAPPPDPAQIQGMMAQMQALQLRNAARHQDAIIILSGTGLVCTAKHFPILADHLASLPPAEITPIRLNGARQLRLGIAQSVLGYVTALGDATTNKVRVRGYVTELAAPLAGALTPELRAELVTALAQLPPTRDADALATTDLLKSAMATTECVALCLYK